MKNINFKKATALTTTLILSAYVLTGCNEASAMIPKINSQTAIAAEATAPETTSSSNTAVAATNIVQLTYKDKDINSSYDEATATKITLNNDKISVNGNGASANGSILTISAEGTYIINGTLTNGQIVITTGKEDKVRLILNGVTITNKTGAAIYATAADKLTITLAEGTKNIVTDGGSNFAYTLVADEEPNAAIFAKCDLIFNGTGSLEVNAGFNNGIGTKDDLVIVSGNYVINAVNDGLRGRDSVTVLNGDLQITAGSDGIQSNNNEDATKGWISLEGGSVNINSANDGVQAETMISVKDGTYNITTGANTSSDATSDSFKGLKATTDIMITGGNITVNSKDDSIHANRSIKINNGNLTLESGDDGVHADNTLDIEGGVIQIGKSYEGLEAANINITNGEINLVSTDDGINAAGGNDEATNGAFGKDNFSQSNKYSLNISGGKISFVAGGDGLDSNGAINISGGEIVSLINSSPDNGAIDSDGIFTATGGTIIYGGTGAGTTPSDSSTQSYVVVNDVTSGTQITVKKDGKNIANITPSVNCQYLVISTPDIKSGDSYEIYSNDALLTTVTAGTGNIGGMMGGRGGQGGFGGQGGQRGQGGFGGQGGKPQPPMGNGTPNQKAQ